MAVTYVPYSYKFYQDLIENMDKGHKAEHPSATVQTKELSAIIYEVTPNENKEKEEK